jgi:hypothetical protein
MGAVFLEQRLRTEFRRWQSEQSQQGQQQPCAPSPQMNKVLAMLIFYLKTLCKRIWIVVDQSGIVILRWILSKIWKGISSGFTMIWYLEVISQGDQFVLLLRIQSREKSGRLRFGIELFIICCTTK